MKGVNVNSKDRDGKTALIVAEEKGHTEIVQLLKEVQEPKKEVKIDKDTAHLELLEAAKKGMRIKEVSVPMPVRNKGKSQFNMKNYILYPFKMIDRVVRVLLWR